VAYSDDILTLAPDHRWKFDGDSIDDVGALASTDTSVDFTGTPLCEDTTNSMFTNADGDQCTSTTSNDTSYATNDILYAGWFMTNKIQQPPCRLMGDGGTTQSMAIYLGFGNSLIFEVDYGDTLTLQIYGSTPLEANRKYHLAIGYTSSNIIVAYLDGVLQTETTNTSGNALATTRGTIKFGGSTATSDFATGGAPLKLVSAKSGYYNQWATFNAGIPTQTQIREVLFEKGALADIYLGSGTEASMQSDVETYIDGNTYGNAPLTLDIQDVAGGGDLNLTFSNVTFDSKTSIHVRWLGAGTLTLTNNNSNTSIVAATNGGTVNIINPTALTIASDPVGYLNGAEIRIYDDEVSSNSNYDTELSGVETHNGDTYVYSHNGDTNDIIIQVLKSGYEELILPHTLTSSDETVTVFPVIEENA